MKKVRVIKETPFSNIGEINYIREDGCILFEGTNISPNQIERLIREGWIEYVEEEKTIIEKLQNINIRLHDFGTGPDKWWLTRKTAEEIHELERQHFLERFDKVAKEYDLYVLPINKLRETISEG